MKIAVIFIIAVLIGVFSTQIWNNLNTSYFIVRVIDNDKCMNREYIVDLESHSVSVKGEQIELKDIVIALEAEAFIFVMPPLDSKKEYTYKFRAKYSNCPDILSEARTVERGWLLYETIKDGKVTHTIRSR